MLTFTGPLDYRTRTCGKPQVARLMLTPPPWRQNQTPEAVYCIIGTPYGHLHTSGGDVRTWRSYSGARRALRRLSPLWLDK